MLSSRPISDQEKFPRTENFPKISLLKVENVQLHAKFFSDGKFVLANRILQKCLSVDNFEWKWPLIPCGTS
jgi:hypothetical protein